MITVNIPCKKHVKKYLILKYGSVHKFSKTSLIGTLIFHVLDKRCPKTDHSLKNYDEKYSISITERYYNTKGFDLGYKKRRYLALCFEKIFWEDLIQFIDISKKQSNIKALTAMRLFLNHYGINETDVNYESLYRHYQREKN